jgi:hypothetical protein
VVGALLLPPQDPTSTKNPTTPPTIHGHFRFLGAGAVGHCCCGW